MNWWQYLLLVNVYLVLFYGFYALLLRRETFFQLNRLYLVSAALLSFFIPLIQADWVKNLFITQKVQYSLYGGGANIIYHFKTAESTGPNIGQLLAGLYLAGVLFLSIRLVWQLSALNKIIKQPTQAVPFSFFKKIKLNDDLSDSDIIIAHEQVHAKQWHSADVMIVEAVMIINWFNPVVYFYRRAIKHIHEFIADNHITQKADKADYALLLLNQTFNAPTHGLANHFFNHSLLKQRIMMLQKNKSQRTALLKYGLSAPLFILMLILSSATVNNSRAIRVINRKAGQVFTMQADTLLSTKFAAINTPIKNSTSSEIKQARFAAEQKTDTVPTKPLDSTQIKMLKRLPGVNVGAGGQVTVGNQQVTKVRINGQDYGNGSELFTVAETEPSFPGGYPEFYKFLQKEVQYPAVDRENNVQGKVMVTFIVEKDGSLNDVQALRGPSPTIDAEAVRVISISPKWIPGIQNGKPVRVQFTVPVSFSLGAEDTVKKINIVYGRLLDTTKRITNIRLLPPAPIYIVNNKTMDADFQLSYLDVNTIESIRILHDKSAVALYGPKAVNGVVIITTKK
jgi:TonB family protein